MARGTVYNRVFTRELWDQVNKENKRILDDWMAEYKQQKKAKTTLDQYYNDARIVFIYILKEHDNKSILELNKKDFRNFSLWSSEDCGHSGARTNRLKSCINSMLTFCEEDDDYDYDMNIAKKVKGVPKERVRDNDDDFFFTFEEFIKVRDILVERGRLQDAVLFSLGFDSAGRKNELYQVKKQGLLDGNKTNIVVGKRGKKFPLVYLDDTKELIRKYLEERGDDDIDSLWVKGTGTNKKPVTPDTLYNRMCSVSNILSEIRGEKCEIFCHSLRHARLECLAEGNDKRLLDKNGNPIKYELNQVMKFAHHSDVSTTQSYLKNKDEEEIDAMFGFSSK